MTQYGFYFNGQRCTGCKTCVMACKDKNDLAETINFRNVLEYGGGTWTRADDGTWGTDTFAYNVSVACNHCDMPACLGKCPQGALTKDDETGAVLRDEEKCIGCGTCVAACPYGAPKVDAEKGKSRHVPRPRGCRADARVRGGLSAARPGLRRHRRAAREVR